MISELYEALVDAGATEEKAKEAAEALACMDAGGRAASGTKAGTAENLNSKDTIAEVKAELAGDIAGLDEKLSGKITELDQRLSGEIAETRKDIHKLQLDVAVLKWMVGATLTGVAAIIVKLFFAA